MVWEGIRDSPDHTIGDGWGGGDPALDYWRRGGAVTVDHIDCFIQTRDTTKNAPLPTTKYVLQVNTSNDFTENQPCGVAVVIYAYCKTGWITASGYVPCPSIEYNSVYITTYSCICIRDL